MISYLIHTMLWDNNYLQYC